jgi:hypothetical protein
LANHAQGNGVQILDLTAVFENRIDRDIEEILQRNGAVAPEAGVVEALRGLQANLY